MSNCPNCLISLDGDLIYDYFLNEYKGDEARAKEVAAMYGATSERGRWRREIGIEIMGYYDGVVIHKCPECGYAWKRFDWVDDSLLGDYNGKSEAE